MKNRTSMLFEAEGIGAILKEERDSSVISVCGSGVEGGGSAPPIFKGQLVEGGCEEMRETLSGAEEMRKFFHGKMSADAEEELVWEGEERHCGLSVLLA